MNRSVIAAAAVTAVSAFIALPAAAGGDDGTAGATFFAASLNGANEVPAAGGDRDGSAVAFLEVDGDEVSFAVEYHGIAAPVAGDLHQGVKGANGNVKISFFAFKQPDGRTSVTGTVRVRDQRLLDELKANPGDFYVDLHTGEFPDGAVRGQVHKLTSTIDMKRALLQNFKASVIRGAQIYACTKQVDGTFAFTQDNVSASLQHGIAHFFAKAGPAGPPEWRAADRSAVTGTVLTRTPNGAGNIAELDIAATQVGRPEGLLAGTDEILRLNTVGGVAPTGKCDPATQPTVAVPYRADYLFVHAIG
ncbi:CHRD domain-containing protein [Streptosporangium sp. CA-135522]|uniref:CHRD domain-containing protein n=1 Tax=Streptosporangium sp. CA-135522 TaxID=3240072 RepID=UPI003D8B02E1